MNRLIHKLHNQELRQRRTRSKTRGNAGRPRLSVHISNSHVSAQLIDDAGHKTIAYATTVGAKDLTGTMSQKATKIGSEIAKKAASAKVKTIVFDRGAKLYHGRIKALADAARAGGLKF